MSERGRARLHYLDALRGIAAGAVVVAHYVLDLPHQAGDPPASGFIAGFDRIFDVGKFGVVLFFLISGYIIPNSLGATGDRIGRFCITRFFRLYPLYWFALAIGVMLPLPVMEHGYRLDVIAANITMIQGYLHRPDIIGAAWTLQIEVTFYVTCVVLAARHRMASPAVCTAMSLGFLALASSLAVARNLLVLKLPVALPLALSAMYLGTVWRQATLMRAEQAIRCAPWLIGVFATMVVPISLIGYNHDFGFNESWLPYVTSYLLALTLFLIGTTKVMIEWRPLVWLGEISYSLYLIHPVVAAAFFYAGFVSVAMPVTPVVLLPAMLAVAVVAAWATYRFIERPFIGLGRRFIPTPKGSIPAGAMPARTEG